MREEVQLDTDCVDEADCGGFGRHTMCMLLNLLSGVVLQENDRGGRVALPQTSYTANRVIYMWSHSKRAVLA